MGLLLLLGTVVMSVVNFYSIPETSTAVPKSYRTTEVTPEDFNNIPFVVDKPNLGDKPVNLIISPIGIALILYQIASGTRGRAKDEIYLFLGLPGASDSAFIQKRQNLVNDLRNAIGGKFKLSNRIYYNETIRAKEEFTDMMIECDKNNFVDSKTSAVDFTKTEYTSLFINAWAWENGNIHYPIAPSDLSPDMNLVLANTVTFESDWLNSFNTNWTELRRFNLDAERHLDVPTMHGYDYYKYGSIDNIDSRFIEIPYKKTNTGNETRMLIIVPNNQYGFADFLKTHIDVVNSKRSYLNSTHPIHVYLPKFMLQSVVELKKPLQELNLSKIFDESADFTNIADRSAIKVDQFFHMASIDVYEGRQRNIPNDDASGQPEMRELSGYEFFVDRPFAFAIISELDIPIFVGIVTDPTIEIPRTTVSPKDIVWWMKIQRRNENKFISTPRTKLYPNRTMENPPSTVTRPSWWNPSSASSERRQALGNSPENLNNFSFKLIQPLIARISENFFYSPTGITLLLSQLIFGTRGCTRDEVYPALGFSPSNESGLIEERRSLVDYLRNAIGVKFQSANGFFYHYLIVPKERFMNMVNEHDDRNIIDSTAVPVDLASYENTTKLMNSWINYHSNRIDKNPIKPRSLLDGSSSLILLNSVSFESNWLNSFDARWTESRKFHLNAETYKNVPTMHGYDYYNHGSFDDIDAKFIEIPFKKPLYGDETRMLIIVPNGGRSLGYLKANIRRAITSEKSFLSSQHPVHVYLPKFKLESSTYLVNAMKDVNLRRIFETFADFRGIDDRRLPMVADIRHFAVLDVNEGVQKDDLQVFRSGSGAPDVRTHFGHEFVVDRPFAVAIMTESRVPLLVGIVVDPSNDPYDKGIHATHPTSHALPVNVVLRPFTDEFRSDTSPENYSTDRTLNSQSTVDVAETSSHRSTSGFDGGNNSKKRRHDLRLARDDPEASAIEPRSVLDLKKYSSKRKDFSRF